MKHNFLTVDELAEKLSVPRTWVYRFTRIKGPGALPVIRVGKYCRFDLDEVLEWLRAQNTAGN